MKRSKLYILVAVVVLSLCIVSCATVPITERRQLSLVSASNMLSMSLQQYDDFLNKNKVSTNAAQVRMVKRAGGRIQKAVERFFIENDMSQELRNYDWEFNLIESDEVNAWCMPGGKVAVYTGIMPLARDENGLAVIMGHEIAHAVAGHGGERMSHLLMVQMGGVALSAALSLSPQITQQLWSTAFGLGAQVGLILPYSRLQEHEADRLGLIFMAMAGYPPDVAVPLWERLAAQKSGNVTPAFLSTHPTDASRIAEIRSSLPEAWRYYRKQ